jgi:hypothetical protein
MQVYIVVILKVTLINYSKKYVIVGNLIRKRLYAAPEHLMSVFCTCDFGHLWTFYLLFTYSNSSVKSGYIFGVHCVHPSNNLNSIKFVPQILSRHLFKYLVY